MDLVERVNKGEIVDSQALEVYQESSNSAEKFLSHHAQALLDLRRAHQHMLLSLQAIDYGDQKVLSQFMSVCGFLGLTDQRAEPVIRFASSAIARRDYALALEAIQNGVAYDLQQGGAYTSDRENCQYVAGQYDRAAQCIAWSSGQDIEWNNRQTKVGYVVTSIADDESSGRTLRSLARHTDSKRLKLFAYSTEAFIRRDKQQFGQTTYTSVSTKRGSSTIETINKQKVPTWIAPSEGDIVSVAKELADQLIKDRVDVVIFDTNQSDPIASIVANWQVARVKMNLCRRTPIYASGIHCITYTDQTRYDADKEYWQRRGVETKFMLEGIDLDENLGSAPQRSAYGIPDSAIVLATSSADLDRTLSEEFVETMIEILRTHPHAVYLLIGDGEAAWQKRKFESAGVAKRVGYAGKRKDLPGFLRIADLYLAEFPASSAAGVLQAMSIGTPVVAMRCGESAEQSQAAAFAGSECTIAGRDANSYIEHVNKIIRESGYRKIIGQSMRSRVEQHFAFNQTARQLEQICDQLLQQSISPSVNQLTLTDSPSPLANVA
jgi:predicted O-linked N-acetylglucosamine transferase (SPINDLY family)